MWLRKLQTLLPLPLVVQVLKKREPLRPSRLGFPQDDPSHYRSWTEKLVRDAESKSALDTEVLFSGLMIAIAKFELTGSRFLSDAARFEVACYLFSAVDRFLYQKMLGHREDLMAAFLNQFASASSQALSLPLATVGKCLNSRISVYGTHYRNGGSERDLIERLTGFVMFAKQNGTPSDSEDVNLTLTLERTRILIEVGIWSDCYLRAVSEILENWKSSSNRNSIFGEKDLDLLGENLADMERQLGDHKRVEALIEQTERIAETLHRSLVVWVPLQSAGGLDRMNAFVREAWKENCLFYSFALVCLCHVKANSEFFQKASFDPFLFNMANYILKLSENTLKQLNKHDRFDEKKATAGIATELLKARQAAESFVDAVIKRSAEPDSALLAYLADGIGVAGPNRPPFLESLRSFTKNALKELSTAIQK